MALLLDAMKTTLLGIRIQTAADTQLINAFHAWTNLTFRLLSTIQFQTFKLHLRMKFLEVCVGD